MRSNLSVEIRGVRNDDTFARIAGRNDFELLSRSNCHRRVRTCFPSIKKCVTLRIAEMTRLEIDEPTAIFALRFRFFPTTNHLLSSLGYKIIIQSNKKGLSSEVWPAMCFHHFVVGRRIRPTNTYTLYFIDRRSCIFYNFTILTDYYYVY